MRKNLDLMHILTLPFPSHAKTLTSEEYYWEHTLQPSEWEVWGAEGYKRRAEAVAWASFFCWESFLSTTRNLQGGARKLLVFLKTKWKKGLGEKADANFATNRPCQVEIAAHFVIEQSVSSSLPNLRKWKVGEKNTSEKPNGCGGLQVIQWKREK